MPEMGRGSKRNAAVGAPTFGPEIGGVLDRVLQAAVESGGAPGVVALVTSGNGVLYRRAVGVMDEDGRVPMRIDAIFRIRSMTKPITSLAVLMLYEEGRFRLDDPAESYLPELRGREVLVGIDPADSSILTRPASRPMTIRDLLRHTSGFGYAFASNELVELNRFSAIPDRDQPLLHDPGERWTYGMGPAFLGWLVEATTAQSLPDFLQTRIFGPLGMKDTSFSLAPEDEARLVATCRRLNGRLEAERRETPYTPFVRGDGRLLSTADDYARFVQLVLGRGERDGVRLIREETLSEMVRDQLDDLTVVEQPGAIPSLSRPFPLGAGRDGFALGFQVTRSGGGTPRPIGTLSWAGLENTHFWIDLENRIGVILMMQVLPFYDEGAIDLLTSFEQTLYANLRTTGEVDTE